MTPEQALMVLDQIAASSELKRPMTLQAMQATQILREFIEKHSPKDPKKEG